MEKIGTLITCNIQLQNRPLKQKCPDRDQIWDSAVKELSLLVVSTFQLHLMD